MSTRLEQNSWFHIADDADLEILITDSAGNTVSIVNYQAIFRLAKWYGSPTLIEKTVAGGGISMIQAGSGIATVKLAKGDTDDLVPGDYAWQLILIDPAGVESVASGGYLTALPKLAAKVP